MNQWDLCLVTACLIWQFLLEYLAGPSQKTEIFWQRHGAEERVLCSLRLCMAWQERFKDVCRSLKVSISWHYYFDKWRENKHPNHRNRMSGSLQIQKQATLTNNWRWAFRGIQSNIRLGIWMELAPEIYVGQRIFLFFLWAPDAKSRWLTPGIACSGWPLILCANIFPQPKARLLWTIMEGSLRK